MFLNTLLFRFLKFLNCCSMHYSNTYFNRNGSSFAFWLKIMPFSSNVNAPRPDGHILYLKIAGSLTTKFTFRTSAVDLDWIHYFSQFILPLPSFFVM